VSLHICEIKNEHISVSLTVTIDKKDILHTHWLTRTYTRAHTHTHIHTFTHTNSHTHAFTIHAHMHIHRGYTL